MGEKLITNYDIRGTKESGLTVERAWNIGKAVADWLPVMGAVAVAYHPSQKDIAEAVIEGLRLQGRAVIDWGREDKEAVKAQVLPQHMSGAVIVDIDNLAKVTTIELYQHEGKLIAGDSGLHEISTLMDAGNFVPAALKGELTYSV